MQIESLDHVVLLVRDIERSSEFYKKVLGLWAVERHGVVSMHFEGGAIVLLDDPGLLQPSPSGAARGAVTLSLRASGTVEQWTQRFSEHGAAPLTGPRERIGSSGAVHSVYVHDPDGNVVELALSTRG